MRTIVRNLLGNIGVKSVTEVGDGIAALEKIREGVPDVIILDWEMPLLNGPELVRIVRSPGVFRRRIFPSSCSAPMASNGELSNRSSSA
jgi:CheY-like chemotaxis protein